VGWRPPGADISKTEKIHHEEHEGHEVGGKINHGGAGKAVNPAAV
jgi:hypothetical protein